MDRRHFLSTLGLTAAGPVLAATRPAAPSPVGFPVNGAPLGLLEPALAPGVLPESGFGLTLGYVPGSGEALLRDRDGAAPPDAAEVSIYRLVTAPLQTIDTLSVTVHFAVQEGPVSHVPYFAWQLAGGLGASPRQSSPVSFSTTLPEGALISVNYGLRGPGQTHSQGGSLTYRLGGNGMGPGTYVLAAPSAATGAPPVWADLGCADEAGRLVRRDGGPIDFDYLVIALAPA